MHEYIVPFYIKVIIFSLQAFLLFYAFIDLEWKKLGMKKKILKKI